MTPMSPLEILKFIALASSLVTIVFAVRARFWLLVGGYAVYQWAVTGKAWIGAFLMAIRWENPAEAANTVNGIIMGSSILVIKAGMLQVLYCYARECARVSPRVVSESQP